jgi:tRNA modification GTPase
MPAETIVAVATPPGFGGIGIVRVSGPRCSEIAKAVLGAVPEPRVATLRRFLLAPAEPIDEGIALFFQAPHSFTGEDVLELQGHGGPVVTDQVFARCLSLGCRAARPGEFTERAFLNGKLDLAQAEAVADLIESTTALSAKLAVRSLQGALSSRVNAQTEALIELRMHVEATLDFPDEDLDPRDRSLLSEGLSSLYDGIGKLLAEAQQGERIRDGLEVVIAGPPNAGKSSLLNLMSQSQTAIVTEVPGTTRDPLNVRVDVDGLPISLTDTAGLRDTQDRVEQQGVQRARDKISDADLVLWVYDCTLGFDESQLKDLGSERPVTLIRNKIDLDSNRLPSQRADLDEIAFSTVTEQGLDELRQHLRNRAGVAHLGDGAFVARRRHLDALRRTRDMIAAAHRGILDGFDLELVAYDLRVAQQAIGEITGEVTPDDLLGRIFSSFCIGK